MTEQTPRERRYQRTQQAILDAARQLIHEKGVEGLSMRAIAEIIDYSPAGLYEYYGSKEEIVGALCGQGFQRFTQALGRVDVTLPAEEYLVELGIAYINFALQNADFFLLMFTTAPVLLPDFFSADKPDPAQSLQSDDSFSILLRGVDRCVREGIFPPRPGYGVIEMAHASWSLVHGIAMLQLSLLQRLPFNAEQIRTTLRLHHAGLSST